jgi:hypothetical protein
MWTTRPNRRLVCPRGRTVMAGSVSCPLRVTSDASHMSALKAKQSWPHERGMCKGRAVSKIELGLGIDPLGARLDAV